MKHQENYFKLLKKKIQKSQPKGIPLGPNNLSKETSLKVLNSSRRGLRKQGKTWPYMFFTLSPYGKEEGEERELACRATHPFLKIGKVLTLREFEYFICHLKIVQQEE